MKVLMRRVLAAKVRRGRPGDEIADAETRAGEYKDGFGFIAVAK